MKSSKDKYNFNQASPSGQFGFETFKSKVDDKHYFHFNNQNGKPILFSQSYAAARSRDNGLASVQSNATDNSRFAIQEEEGKHYFSLVAGNNQEIARSAFFDQKDELDLAISQIMEYALLVESDTAKDTVNSNKKSAKKQTVTPAPKPSTEGMPQTKSRITIDFYRNKTGESLKGRIEHPLSGDKVKFQGFDKKTILQFMEQHIPTGEKLRVPLSQKAGIVKEDLPDVHAINNGLKTQFIPMGASFNLAIPLPESAHGFATYNLEVLAKRLGRSQKIRLGQESSSLSKQGSIVYAIDNCPLAKDTYRLLINLSLSKNKEHEQVETLKGSCLLLVQ